MTTDLISKPLLGGNQFELPSEEEYREFAAKISNYELLKYETIDPVRRRDYAKYVETLNNCIKGPWRLEGANLKSIKSPIDWHSGTRSNQVHLHAWTPVSSLLLANEFTKDDSYFKLAVDFAIDWLGNFHEEALNTDPEALARSGKFDNNLPWYDMALGLRAYRIAFLVDKAYRLNYPPADCRLLLESLMLHIRLLLAPGAFTVHSNHGLYQSLGLLSACKRFGWWHSLGNLIEPALNMLKTVLSFQITDDGVLKEHSSGYQLSYLTSLQGARDSKIIDQSSNIIKLIEDFENVVSWMIRPDRSLTPFGDTDSSQLVTLGPDDKYEDPGLKYLLSNGASGELPPNGVFHSKLGGFAAARIYEKDPESASYLAQMCSFFSRVHKHADNGTFVWSEGKTAILSDPGRYGYEGRTIPGSELHKLGFWYGDTNRIYVEKTSAHNCIEVDGIDQPRASVPFYGAAIDKVVEKDGLIIFQSNFPISESVKQQRILILSPKNWLVVFDLCEDSKEELHDFRQYFKFGPGWTAGLATASAFAASTLHHTLWCEELCGAKAIDNGYGLSNPMRGWASLKGLEMLKSQSICFEHKNSSKVNFVSVFAFEKLISKSKCNKQDFELGCFNFEFEIGKETFEFEISNCFANGAANLDINYSKRTVQRRKAQKQEI